MVLLFVDRLVVLVAGCSVYLWICVLLLTVCWISYCGV